MTGFDITGTSTEVDLVFPQVKSACDCIFECLKRYKSCSAFVYKFTVPSSHRTCTLYSNFNLPPSVTIGFDENTSVDINKVGLNTLTPQPGSPVPHCTADGTNGHDHHCVSGGLW